MSGSNTNVVIRSLVGRIGVTQVGCSRLGHLMLPISGKPEIGAVNPPPSVLVVARIACADPLYLSTKSSARISLNATAECSMPLPADWPSPLTA
jgi:hypothetical protein